MAYMVLKRIDPMSFAKVYAVITALVIFVICLIHCSANNRLLIRCQPINA